MSKTEGAEFVLFVAKCANVGVLPAQYNQGPYYCTVVGVLLCYCVSLAEVLLHLQIINLSEQVGSMTCL